MSDTEAQEAALEAGSTETIEPPAQEPEAPPEKPQAPLSRRETIAQALAEAKGEAKPQTPKTDSAPPPKAEGGRVRDEHGRFTKSEATRETVKPTTKPATVTPPPAPIQEAAAKEPPPATPELKPPPPTWKPLAREKWAALPAEVQQEIHRREAEFTTHLTQSAEARKGWDGFRTAVAPYEAMIRASGVEPLQAVANIFRVAAGLATLPAWDRAQLAANLLRSNAVDPDLLSQAYNGQQPTQEQLQQRALDPRQLAQAIKQEIVQDLRTQQTQALSQSAGQSVEAFISKMEFGEQLRQRMGALMRAYAEQGQSLSMEQAYDMASQLDKEVSEVLRQREAKKKLEENQHAIEKAKAASSSVKGSPLPPMNGLNVRDRRSLLAANLRAAMGEQ